MYVPLNSCGKAVIVSKVAKVEHLAFKNTPEAFHGSIVDAAANPGHTLYHSRLVQPGLELLTCILKTSITMKQRAGIGVFGNGQIEGVKNELVIVAPAYGKRDNTFVFKVENGAQIQLGVISALEFRNVGQPFFVKFFSREITAQDVIRRDFRCRMPVLRAFSANDSFQAYHLGKTVYALVIVTGLVPIVQFIGKPPVSISPVEFGVKITELVKQVLVLPLAVTLAAMEPFIIG